MAVNNEYLEAGSRQINNADPLGSPPGPGPAENVSAPALTGQEATPASYGTADPLEALAEAAGQAPAVDARGAVFGANTPIGGGGPPTAAQSTGTPAPPLAPTQPLGPSDGLGGVPNGAVVYLERHQIYQDGQSSDTLYQIVDQGNEAPVLLPIASSTLPSNAGQVVSTSYSNLAVLSQPAYSSSTYSVTESQATGQAAEPYGASPYNGYDPYPAVSNSDPGYPSQGKGGVISPAPSEDDRPAAPATASVFQGNGNDEGNSLADVGPTGTPSTPERSTEAASLDDVLSLLAQNSTTDPQTPNTWSEGASGDTAAASGYDSGFDNAAATTGSDNDALVSGIENQLIETIAGYITHAVEGYLGSALSSQLPALLAAIVPAA